LICQIPPKENTENKERKPLFTETLDMPDPSRIKKKIPKMKNNKVNL
jgi:hypothetical protein